ncbi:MAG: hypothetical protein C4524_12725 [Candidatus Zixiibacteriota bacterium]|nr:MAG: hypothetical protein C4524_12725 [candidate division Zixibacteria bacterium]
MKKSNRSIGLLFIVAGALLFLAGSLRLSHRAPGQDPAQAEALAAQVQTALRSPADTLSLQLRGLLDGQPDELAIFDFLKSLHTRGDIAGGYVETSAKTLMTNPAERESPDAAAFGLMTLSTAPNLALPAISELDELVAQGRTDLAEGRELRGVHYLLGEMNQSMVWAVQVFQTPEDTTIKTTGLGFQVQTMATPWLVTWLETRAQEDSSWKEMLSADGDYAIQLVNPAKEAVHTLGDVQGKNLLRTVDLGASALSYSGWKVAVWVRNPVKGAARWLALVLVGAGIVLAVI